MALVLLGGAGTLLKTLLTMRGTRRVSKPTVYSS